MVSRMYRSPISINLSITLVALIGSIRFENNVRKADAINGSIMMFFFLICFSTLGALFYKNFLMFFSISKSLGVSLV